MPRNPYDEAFLQERDALAPLPEPPTTLPQAMAQREQTDQAAALLDAASLANRAFGGHAGDLGATARSQRDQGLKDMIQARVLEDQDAERTTKARKAALEAALARPDSPESARLRDQF